MHCPRCEQPLATVEIGDVEIDFCLSEHGIWLDRDELESIVCCPSYAEKALALTRFLTPNMQFDSSEPRAKCPRCNSELLQVHAADRIHLDECPRACGIWFDRGEVRAILEMMEREGVPIDPKKKEELCVFEF